ncbi:hypothetical protein CHARACLAT_008009, partial [Characodon lateralis]|nr:hypothetical protein [Characodon lateralis]
MQSHPTVVTQFHSQAACSASPTLLAASNLIYIKENTMVEQTRRPNRAVTLQAGPGEVVDVNLRIHDRAARVIGRQLAVIGDHLDQDFARRDLNWPPTPLNLLRPARSLTRIIY